MSSLSPYTVCALITAITIFFHFSHLYVVSNYFPYCDFSRCFIATFCYLVIGLLNDLKNPLDNTPNIFKPFQSYLRYTKTHLTFHNSVICILHRSITILYTKILHFT